VALAAASSSSFFLVRTPRKHQRPFRILYPVFVMYGECPKGLLFESMRDTSQI
jgi:hypothetical protein